MKIYFNEIFLFLATIYFILVSLATFNIVGKYTLHFELFGLLVGILGVIAIIKQEKPIFNKKIIEKENIGELLKLLLLVSIIIILATRIIPYFDNSIPLGYDPGIYKYSFEMYEQYLPNLPFTELDLWLQRSEPQGFFTLTNILYIFGFSTDQIMIPFFILTQLILGLIIYTITKHFFGKKEATIAIFLYAISIIEFKVYWFFYIKNVLGLIFLLTSFYLYSKKKYLPAALVAGFLAGTHRPTFFLFTIMFGLNFILDYKNLKNNLKTGLLITFICLGFYIGKFDQLLFTILIPTLQEPAGPGTFLDFFQYQFSILIYLPFAVMGGIYLFKQKEKRILLIGAIVCLVIVAFQLIFYNRFIIFLEIFVLIIAAYGIKLFLEMDTKKVIQYFILTLFIITSIFAIFQESTNSTPLIIQEELDAIKLINTMTEQNAKILVTNSHYSPWVKGYTTRITIAPGLFDEDKWNRTKWEYFWNSADENQINSMLLDYEKPIYVFISSKSFGNNEKFQGNCFEKIILNNNALLYKYICD